MADGIIDIHAHILPGVDDGAQVIEDSLAMAQEAVDSGVRIMVATPHSNYEPRFASLVESRVRALQYRLRREGIPLRLLPGMEIFADEHTPARLAEGELLPLNGTRYVLVEFDFEESPLFINDTLHAIQALHFVPVVAHPERYACVRDDWRLAAEWRQNGYGVQVNKGSLLGRFGGEVQRTAVKLLVDKQVTTVASDAHAPDMRTPDMSPVSRFLREALSPDAERQLLWDMPRRLLADEEL